MDNLWLLVLVVFAVIIVAALALSMFNKQAPANRKPEIPKIAPKEKYHVAPEEFREEFAEEINIDTLRVRREPEEPFIPHYYGVDRMVLAPKDPNWLYVYWEVSEYTRQAFLRQYGEVAWCTSQQVLRVYDVSSLSSTRDLIFHSYREIIVDPFADSWFIEVGQADRSFVVELGRLLEDGSYVKLLTSNVASTPRNAISNKIDQKWPWIEGIYQSIGGKPMGSSEVLSNMEGGFSPLGVSSPGYKE